MRRNTLVGISSVVLLPAYALACPVCYTAREASRLAFLWTAIFLTLVPLGLIGGILYWLWRRIKANDAPRGPGFVASSEKYAPIAMPHKLPPSR